MNIKKILVGAAAGAFLFGATIVPAFAANGNGGNVGTAYNITGATYDAFGNYVAYSCGSVHRTQTATGFEEKESCTLVPGASLPTKALKQPETAGWYSDYIFATQGTYELATSWSQQFTPDGTVNIVSDYAPY